jgi:predicted AlkP superfamily pyrophosphatase or phosphodiesterase
VRETRITTAAVLITAIMIVGHLAAQTPKKPPAKPVSTPALVHRNVILFVTDGLRHDSVTPETAPNIFSLRQQGVDFINSHALYPTFTTPNASTFATGHGLGDTGDFGNGLYVGGPLKDPQNDSKATVAPFIENDLIIGELNRRFHGNFLTEETLMDLARRNGYAVATVGKLGPTAIQDASQIALTITNGKPGELQLPKDAIVMDDSTGRDGKDKRKLGIPLPADLEAELKTLGLGAMAPDRANGQKGSQQDNSVSGNVTTPGTLGPNRIQQQYLADAVTQAILPRMIAAKKPFFIVFWSRDPDGTQHNQGDSLNQLSPGINGPSSRAAIHNADANLGQIMNYLKAANLYANTDIVVVADHGFSTISKNKVGPTQVTSSFSSSRIYDDVKPGYLPPGFLAVDLAHGLQDALYDPDGAIDPKTHKYPCLLGGGDGDTDCPKDSRHPSNGSGVIGGSGKAVLGEKTDARVIVAANGGSDLIYLPGTADGPKTQADKEFARRVAEILLEQDYVDGVFADDAFGDIPGALRLSNIGLKGAHPSTPVPAMVVNFKSFSLDSQTPQLGRLTRVEVADSTLQEGQGMHGSFSRADTFNNLVAAGPDFKSHYIDRAPVSNADVAMTLAEVMRLPMPVTGSKLQGRVAKESLATGKSPAEYSGKVLEMVSSDGPGGVKTMLLFQEHDGHYYYDQACLLRGETICK